MIASMIQRMRVTPVMRSFVSILSRKEAITITRRLKPGKERQEFIVTIGAPNYRARDLLRRARKAGADYPIQDVRVYRKK